MRGYRRPALLTCLCFYVLCHMPQFCGMMNAIRYHAIVSFMHASCDYFPYEFGKTWKFQTAGLVHPISRDAEGGADHMVSPAPDFSVL